MLAARGEAHVSSVPGCPVLVGLGPTACRAESVARWHGGRCQLSLARALKLASAHRTLQLQECNSRPLPWKSRHSQTGRMSGGGKGLRLRWCKSGKVGGVASSVCVRAQWTAAWVMAGLCMSLHSPSHVRVSLTG